MLRKLANYITPDNRDFTHILIILCIALGFAAGVITIIKHII